MNALPAADNIFAVPVRTDFSFSPYDKDMARISNDIRDGLPEIESDSLLSSILHLLPSLIQDMAQALKAQILELQAGAIEAVEKGRESPLLNRLIQYLDTHLEGKYSLAMAGRNPDSWGSSIVALLIILGLGWVISEGGNIGKSQDGSNHQAQRVDQNSKSCTNISMHGYGSVSQSVTAQCGYQNPWNIDGYQVDYSKCDPISPYDNFSLYRQGGSIVCEKN